MNVGRDIYDDSDEDMFKEPCKKHERSVSASSNDSETGDEKPHSRINIIHKSTINMISFTKHKGKEKLKNECQRNGMEEEDAVQGGDPHQTLAIIGTCSEGSFHLNQKKPYQPYTTEMSRDHRLKFQYDNENINSVSTKGKEKLETECQRNGMEEEDTVQGGDPHQTLAIIRTCSEGSFQLNQKKPHQPYTTEMSRNQRFNFQHENLNVFETSTIPNKDYSHFPIVKIIQKLEKFEEKLMRQQELENMITNFSHLSLKQVKKTWRKTEVRSTAPKKHETIKFLLHIHHKHKKNTNLWIKIKNEILMTAVRRKTTESKRNSDLGCVDIILLISTSRIYTPFTKKFVYKNLQIEGCQSNSPNEVSMSKYTHICPTTSKCKNMEYHGGIFSRQSTPSNNTFLQIHKFPEERERKKVMTSCVNLPNDIKLADKRRANKRRLKENWNEEVNKNCKKKKNKIKKKSTACGLTKKIHTQTIQEYIVESPKIFGEIFLEADKNFVSKQIDWHKALFMHDSGADISMISYDFLRRSYSKKFIDSKMKPYENTLTGFTNTEIKSSGSITLNVKLAEFSKSKVISFVVLNNWVQNDILLGTDVQRKFRLTLSFSKEKNPELSIRKKKLQTFFIAPSSIEKHFLFNKHCIDNNKKSNQYKDPFCQEYANSKTGRLKQRGFQHQQDNLNDSNKKFLFPKNGCIKCGTHFPFELLSDNRYSYKKDMITRFLTGGKPLRKTNKNLFSNKKRKSYKRRLKLLKILTRICSGKIPRNLAKLLAKEETREHIERSKKAKRKKSKRKRKKMKKKNKKLKNPDKPQDDSRMMTLRSGNRYNIRSVNCLFNKESISKQQKFRKLVKSKCTADLVSNIDLLTQEIPKGIFRTKTKKSANRIKSQLLEISGMKREIVQKVKQPKEKNKNRHRKCQQLQIYYNANRSVWWIMLLKKYLGESAVRKLRFHQIFIWLNDTTHEITEQKVWRNIDELDQKSHTLQKYFRGEIDEWWTKLMKKCKSMPLIFDENYKFIRRQQGLSFSGKSYLWLIEKYLEVPGLVLIKYIDNPAVIID